MESIKQIQQHVHSGKIGSIKNGIKRNIWRSMKTGSSQFVWLETRKQNNDCEQTQPFFQNVHKNFLIVNSILKTHNNFNIILIQEPPWSIIQSISSSASSEGEVLVGASHHSNWLLFTRPSPIQSNYPRVMAYINIRLSHL